MGIADPYKYPKVINAEQCQVVVGSPVDGCVFYGPFDCNEDAIDWAEKEVTSETWWVAELTLVQCDYNGDWIS